MVHQIKRVTFVSIIFHQVNTIISGSIMVIIVHCQNIMKHNTTLVQNINPLATGNTPVCGLRFEHVNISVHVVSRKHLFRNIRNASSSFM